MCIEWRIAEFQNEPRHGHQKAEKCGRTANELDDLEKMRIRFGCGGADNKELDGVAVYCWTK